MKMLLLTALLLTAGVCEAQSDKSAKGKGKGKKKKDTAAALAPVPGLTRTGTLAGVAESSGLAPADAAGTFYTHGDHGNRPELLKINWEGKVLARVPVPGASNEDWEALAHDDKGHLFIADVGNNANDRRDLTIYRFDPRQPTQPAARIRLQYADQQAFPPADKAARNFDCESVVWQGGQLYLFTRDRGRHRHCRLYRVPDAPGTATAQYVGEYELEGEVSGADVSPDGRQLALIGRERLFLIKLPAVGQLLGGQVRTLPLRGAGQTEGVVFTDDQTLAITTEQGAIYRLELAEK